MEDGRRSISGFGALLLVVALCAVAIGPWTQGALAATEFTGEVASTDDTGTPKATFVEGEGIYFIVTLERLAVPYDDLVRVELQTTSGATLTTVSVRTNVPVVGYYDSTIMAVHFHTPLVGGVGSADAFNLVVYSGTLQEFARQPLIVLGDGLSLTPAGGPHFPGQSVEIAMVKPYETTLFYVQVVNSSGVGFANWSRQMSTTEGYWNASWVIPEDMPDGNYQIRVRSEATQAVLYQVSFEISKYSLLVSTDRDEHLRGERARIHYLALDVATLAPSTGVTIEFRANWTTTSGSENWLTGPLGGSEGVHDFLIPSFVASYSDVYIVYWANESSSGRVVTESIVLVLETLRAEVSLTSPYYEPGSTVSMIVRAEVGMSLLPEATVNISVEPSGGSPIPEYGVAELTTDIEGVAAHTFALNLSAADGTYIVKVVVSKAGNSVLVITTFDVHSSAAIDIVFDKSMYLSGDVAHVELRAIMNNEQLESVPITYSVVFGSEVYGTGTNATGYIDIVIPIDFHGILAIEAIAWVGEHFLTGLEATSVMVADLRLTSGSPVYDAGDLITFNYEIMTNLADGAISWEIDDSIGVRVASGAPAFSKVGSFSYSVPENWPSTSYVGVVSLALPGGLLRDSLTLDLNPVPPMALAPFLRVDNPVEGANVVIPAIHVNGSTEYGAYVKVNGVLVVPDSDGEFSLTVPLLEGTNELTIVASFGINERVETRNVTYDNPIPAMAGQIDALMDDLATTQSQFMVSWAALNATMSNLAASWDNLNQTKTAVTTAWAQVNASQTLIDGVQTELDAIDAMLTAAYASSNGTESSLSSTVQQIAGLQELLDQAQESLNSTRDDLESVQTQLDSMESDLEKAQGNIADKPTETSLWMFAVVAIVASVIISTAVLLLLRSRSGKKPTE